MIKLYSRKLIRCLTKLAFQCLEFNNVTINAFVLPLEFKYLHFKRPVVVGPWPSLLILSVFVTI